MNKTTHESPVIITEPGPQFQDEARPGNMILGMDRTPKGRIWGLWTGTGDKQDTYCILATSDDDSRTWSKPRLVVGAPDPVSGTHYRALVGNLWTDPLGRLWLFFDQQLAGGTGPTGDWFIRCDDPDADVPVWSSPVRLAEGCTLNKPTVLLSGAWLLPVSDWAEKKAWVFASNDQGKTWIQRGGLAFPDWAFDEHMIVELHDGRLWMLARTNAGLHESFSIDQGLTWSVPQPCAIQHLSSRFFIRRLASGKLLLVKNGPIDRRLAKRSHLSAFLSDDDGRTWRGGLVLDERASVSYPDGFQSPDGLIYILYDWNRHTDAEILLAKFREEDVLSGKFISPDAKACILVNKATGAKPILYNGIELPLVWPPRGFDPASAQPMPVPYLERPPHIIPIDVGRQLFVDDFLIESTDLNRRYHQPVKYSGNPVFTAQTPGEIEGSSGAVKSSVYLGHGGVFFDPTDRLYKMFYVAGWRGGLGLATSTDLIHWTRPELGLAGGNLLLVSGWNWTGPEIKTAGTDNCVWLDLSASNPAERIKFLTCWAHVSPEQLPKNFTHSIQVGDGRIWSEGRPTGIAGDYCSFFHNPFRKVWVFSIKQDGPRGRCRYYCENPDFLQGADWSKSVYWTNADHLDAPEPQGSCPSSGETTQLYSLNAVAYESIMIGMHYILRGPSNEICATGNYPKLIDIAIGFSRDGFHWHRPDRHPFIASSRTAGTWDRGYLHSTAGVCLVSRDRLVFPYTGFSGVGRDGCQGMYHGASIGLAMLRRDGFASMDADAKTGTLTTRLLTFSGRYLFVNVDCPHGELRVEVLDEDGRGIVPFSAGNCEVISTDQTLKPVNWKGGDLSTLAGKPVKFRFHLIRGSFYAFWVSPDESGVSRGYVAAGGPDYQGVVDR